MATKTRIIVGFVVVLAILSAVSTIGYRSLENASTLFLDFSRLAGLNVAGSDSVANVNASAYHLEKFMRLSGSGDMDSSIAAQRKALAFVQKALEHTVLPERKQMLESAAARLKEYVEALEQMKNDLAPWYDDYLKIVGPGFEASEKILGGIGDLALQVNNSALLGQINDVWRMLVGLSKAIDNFRQRGTEENAVEIDRLLALGKAVNDSFSASLRTAEGGRAFSEYRSRYEAIAASYRNHRAEAVRAETLLEQTYIWDVELEEIIHKMSAEADAEESRGRVAIIDSNDSARTFMLAASAAGILAGVLFAVFIIAGLISVLNKVSEFARAVADGDFEREAGIREKGEIGSMAAAMQRIPRTLKAILNDYLQLEKEIEAGAIARKVDVGNYHGGFSVLVHGTNNILARLNTIIDNIPSLVIILDKDSRIEYMNNAAKEVAGTDFEGKTCKEVFNRDDDGTEADALPKAAATKQPASGETKAHPRGREMDVRYTVFPILDEAGDLASLLQLFTDLTAIKTQHKMILRVASRASEISDHVAAASGELAARVEEISRGAEVQRERVESTASAMTEMNSTVLEVAHNASRASEQSELTRSKAGAGSDLVDQVVQAINEVNKVALTLQTNMQALGTQAQSIGGVMNVISDIADQTNLLALNAAIEAARAGDAGRGFAVVADEVRKLAEKTMSATQEVSASIKAIQHSTRINIEAVDSAAKSIVEATGLADSSGKALKEIVELASTNSSVVASIATAAEEQSATSEEINRAIEEINQVIGGITDGMTKSSAAVQELSHMAQQLRHVMVGLKK
jgi:methyl-accepting chemotaxis protein